MIPLMMEMLNVLPDSPTQRLFTKENHMINALALDGRYETLRIAILLRTPHSCLTERSGEGLTQRVWGEALNEVNQ